MNTDYLIKMINQIVANFSYAKDEEKIVDLTVDHLQKFWDPRMKQAFIEYAEQDDHDMSDIALAIAKRL